MKPKQDHVSDRRFAAVLSLVMGVVILAFKFWAFHVTGSQGAYSDALESIINVLTAATVIYVIYVSSKPADADHPYGHGKAEYFSAAFEGGLITFAALAIIAKGTLALYRGVNLQQLNYGIQLLGVAGAANLGLGFTLLHFAKKSRSDALRASGQHVISDFITSAAVIAGLLLVQWTGLQWIDPVLAIGVGLHLGWTGLSLVIRSGGALMDAEDFSVLNELLELFKKHRFPGIIRIHHTRVIRSGYYHHIDAHVVLPEFWDVAKAHEQADQFETRVINDYGHDGEMHFHMDPCRRAYCRVCDVQNCPIRQEEFKERLPMTIDEIRNPMEADEFLSARR